MSEVGSILDGQQDTSGAPTEGGQGAPAASGGTGATAAGAPSVTIPENWKDALPDDLKSAPFLAPVKDITTLVKNYANAQKMIGADKIPVPPKGASEQEYRAVFSKLGLPEKPEDYDPGVEKPIAEALGKEFLGEMSKKAHEAGLLPWQAKKMAEWVHEMNTQAEKAEIDQLKNTLQTSVDNLKREWGQAYDQKVSRAKAVLKEFGDKDFEAYIKEMGLGYSDKFVKFLEKVSNAVGEDKIRGGGGGAEPVLSPNEAKEKIREIQANMKSPYYDKNHPEHEKYKRDVSKLFQMAYPSKS